MVTTIHSVIHPFILSDFMIDFMIDIMMFALGSMMAIVFVCFARHLTDWALPLMMVIS